MNIQSKIVVIISTVLVFSMLALWQSNVHAGTTCIYYENTHQTFCWDN